LYLAFEVGLFFPCFPSQSSTRERLHPRLANMLLRQDTTQSFPQMPLITIEKLDTSHLSVSEVRLWRSSVCYSCPISSIVKLFITLTTRRLTSGYAAWVRRGMPTYTQAYSASPSKIVSPAIHSSSDDTALPWPNRSGQALRSAQDRHHNQSPGCTDCLLRGLLAVTTTGLSPASR